MTIEKLTEDERAYLAEYAPHALRIIDAQAAALDRVRAALDRAQGRFRNREHGGVIQGEFYDSVKATLAGAPAPDDCDTVHERFCCEAHRQAVAAVDSLRPRLAAANALAEAAERAHDKADEAYTRWRERAESEAAALRAEVERLRTMNREHEQRWLASERDGMAAESRLAAANALLAEAEHSVLKHEWWTRCAAHLAACAAPARYCSRCRERVSTSGPYCAACATPAKDGATVIPDSPEYEAWKASFKETK